MANDLRVALIHYWLVGMRGGEKVLEALCRMFPQADIFTHVVDPNKLTQELRRHKIVESSVSRLPFAKSLYQNYLGFMPRALEELDLSNYDLVISSEAGPAKGVIPRPEVPHLCYCHSPMRYIWDQYHTYLNSAGPVTRLAFPPLAHKLRKWDVTSANRITRVVANSNHVAARVRSYWGLEPSVVHPPVATQNFSPVPIRELGNFYLWLGELTSYKRPDLALEACRILDRPLIVIGGPQKQARKLAQMAGSKTVFLGRVGDAEVKSYLARCRALLFPGEEDFGIVPVEAMASGRPVIAFGRGGILDTVADGQTGMLFAEQSVDALIDAILRFERSGMETDAVNSCINRAAHFSEDAFRAGIYRNLVDIGAIDLPQLRQQRS